ncbi:hypothetical protein BG74_06475 [Sodalis-like endosymbiont of Proechinophthirus fluctus]|nr:hypothetical protein BG74_06475 [Sodalis-like endosymbiont of Proechinophthirus fluctus]
MFGEGRKQEPHVGTRVLRQRIIINQARLQSKIIGRVDINIGKVLFFTISRYNTDTVPLTGLNGHSGKSLSACATLIGLLQFVGILRGNINDLFQ